MFEKMNCYSGKYIWLLFLVCTCLVSISLKSYYIANLSWFGISLQPWIPQNYNCVHTEDPYILWSQLCIFHVAFTNFTQHFSEASYELSVEVVSYASSSHARDDGLCCDNSQCVDDCNNSFNFCLLRPGADLNSTSDVDPCLNSSEQYVTGVVGGDMREFVIGENLDDGVPNPLLFTGERWPVRIV